MSLLFLLINAVLRWWSWYCHECGRRPCARVPSELEDNVLRAEQFVQEGQSVSQGAEQLIKEAIGIHGGDRSQLTAADPLVGLQSLSALGFSSSAVGHEFDTSSNTK